MNYPPLAYRLLLPLFAVLAILSAGCAMDLTGKSQQFSRFDQAKDEFHFLWVTTDIVASRQPIDDGQRKLTAEQHREIGLAHLESLWKNRENVVLMPGPFGPIAFIRRENRLLETVSLYKREDKTEKFTTNFDLNAIRVQPGEFFVSRQGALAYTHHCTFPGKTIDEAFSLALKAIHPEVAKSSQARLDARKNGGEKRKEWKDLRAELWDGVRQGQRFGLMSKVFERFPEALSDESLELLVQQGNKQAITLKREGMKFTLEMKISPSDASALCSAIEDSLRGELPDPSKAIPPGQLDPYAHEKKQEARANEAFRTSKAVADPEGKTTIIVDALPILKLLEEEGGPWGFLRDTSLSEKQIQEARADVAQVESRKIPVNHELELETALEKFREIGK